MEAGLGAIWGEDPRYTRDVGAPFGHRVGHAVKMTFMAQNRDGKLMPAYARFIAIPGSNFLSNAWRAPGDDTAGKRSRPHRDLDSLAALAATRSTNFGRTFSESSSIRTLSNQALLGK